MCRPLRGTHRRGAIRCAAQGREARGNHLRHDRGRADPWSTCSAIPTSRSAQRSASVARKRFTSTRCWDGLLRRRLTRRTSAPSASASISGWTRSSAPARSGFCSSAAQTTSTGSPAALAREDGAPPSSSATGRKVDEVDVLRTVAPPLIKLEEFAALAIAIANRGRGTQNIRPCPRPRPSQPRVAPGETPEGDFS